MPIFSMKQKTFYLTLGSITDAIFILRIKSLYPVHLNPPSFPCLIRIIQVSVIFFDSFPIKSWCLLLFTSICFHVGYKTAFSNISAIPSLVSRFFKALINLVVFSLPMIGSVSTVNLFSNASIDSGFS